MRILVTVPSLDRSFGGPFAKAALASHLRDASHDAVVVGCGSAANLAGSIGLPTIARFRGTPIPASLHAVRARARGADVVHVLGFRDPVGTAAALVAARAGVPLVLEPCGMYGRKLRSFALKSLFDSTIGERVGAAASTFIATSSLETDELIACGVARDRILRRANGVSLDGIWPLPARGALRDRLGIAPTAPLVLALGRLMRIKGLISLVEAANAEPDLHVLIAGPNDGDGTLEQLLRARKEFGLQGRVFIDPAGMWGADKAQAFADADVLCMPSQSESFGSSAAEAASVGLPVVVTETCGVIDELDSAFTAVARHGDVGSIRKAIRQALQMAGGSARAQSAASLRSRLDWGTLARAQIEIYQSVIDGRRS